MPRRRRPPHEFLRDIEVVDDGIRPYRPARSWSKNKLGILWAYSLRYAQATKKAPARYFVDGLAGSGLYRIKDTGEWFLGSTPLAASVASPPFTKCLSMDLRRKNVRALKSRTVKFGNRVEVEQGDVNRDLLPAMERHIPHNAPIFVLLDPEGAELDWRTVEAAAKFRHGQRKSELLILLATSFLDRLLPRSGSIAAPNEAAMNTCMPARVDWHAIWDARRAGEISPEEGRQAYVSGYLEWLREDLRYVYADSRAITRPQSSKSVYHLVFATDHEAGKDIMEYVFDTMFPDEPNLFLPGFQP